MYKKILKELWDLELWFRVMFDHDQLDIFLIQTWNFDSECLTMIQGDVWPWSVRHISNSDLEFWFRKLFDHDQLGNVLIQPVTLIQSSVKLWSVGYNNRLSQFGMKGYVSHICQTKKHCQELDLWVN